MSPLLHAHFVEQQQESLPVTAPEPRLLCTLFYSSIRPSGGSDKHTLARLRKVHRVRRRCEARPRPEPRWGSVRAMAFSPGSLVLPLRWSSDTVLSGAFKAAAWMGKDTCKNKAGTEC